MFQSKSQLPAEQNILRQKREDFRAEIRRKNTEEIFKQKRAFTKTSQLNPAAVLDEFEQQSSKNFEKIYELTTMEKEVQLRLLEANVLRTACSNFSEEQMEFIFGALGNLSTMDEYKNQNGDLILQTIRVGLEYLNQKTKNTRAVDNILVYVANLCDRNEHVSNMHMDRVTLELLLRLGTEQVESNLSNIYYLLFTIYKNATNTTAENLNMIFEIIAIGVKMQKLTAELRYDLLCLLSHIILPKNELIKELVIKFNIIPFLVNVVKNEQQIIALTIIEKLTFFDDPNPVTILVDLGFLDQINQLLNNQQSHVRMKAFVALSNICYSTQDVVQSVLVHPVFQRILNIFVLERPEEQAHSMACIANILTIGNLKQYEFLLNWRIADIMIECLKGDHAELLYYTIGALGLLCNYGREMQHEQRCDQNPVVRSLRSLNITPLLERLQKHRSIKVYRAADKLLIDYFDYQK